MTSSNSPPKGRLVYRRFRLKAHPLRRVMGVPGLFAAAYGDVGSSIYYALGLVALVSLGATPAALGIAAVFFICTALTYAEGTATIPESGGSASFARYAFNDLTGFIAGWALMFGYIVTIAISAYAVPSYLSFFWDALKESPVLNTGMAMGIIAFLILINILGIRESSTLNFLLAVLSLLMQLLLIVMALLFVFDPAIFIQRIINYWPPGNRLLFGVAIASIAFTGVETASQMAEEARRPRQSVPRALMVLIFVVVIVYAGICLAAFSAMTPPELGREWATDPVAGIAARIVETLTPERISQFPVSPEMAGMLQAAFLGLRAALPVIVALLASVILIIATNAGLLGLSRLAFSLSRFKLVPSSLGAVHPRFRTPWLAILIFGGISMLLLIPGFFFRNIFAQLGGLYAFGSMLSFSMAHAAIIGLRIRQPDLERPFKLKPNLRLFKRDIPISAVLGFIGTFAIWIIILVLQSTSRFIGTIWMVAGLVMYFVYRRRRQKSPDAPPVAPTAT
jgi:APA family basic amino acid/polyamine antiporter